MGSTNTQLYHAPPTASTTGRAGTAMTNYTEDGLTAVMPKQTPPRPPPENLEAYLNRDKEGGLEGVNGSTEMGHPPVEAWPPVDSANTAQDLLQIFTESELRNRFTGILPSTERHLQELSDHISAQTAKLHLGNITYQQETDDTFDGNLSGMKLIIQDENGRDSTDQKAEESYGAMSRDLMMSGEWSSGAGQALRSAPAISTDELAEGRNIFREYRDQGGEGRVVTDGVKDVGKRKSVFITDLSVPERFKSMETSATHRYEEGPVSTSKLLEVGSKMATFPGFEAAPTPLPNAIEPKAEILTAIRTRKDPLLNRRLKRLFTCHQSQSILLDAFWYAFLAIWNNNTNNTNDITTSATSTPPRKHDKPTSAHPPNSKSIFHNPDDIPPVSEESLNQTEEEEDENPSKTKSKEEQHKHPPRTIVAQPPKLHVDDFEEPTHKLFSRIAQNYVKMFVRTEMGDKDGFVQLFPDILAQSIFLSYCDCFPSSIKRFDAEFQARICDLVTEWVVGIKPHIPHCVRWKSPEVGKRWTGDGGGVFGSE
ncbi:hypothetical protein HK097_002994, partial [Rhizophlyctis rosea]